MSYQLESRHLRYFLSVAEELHFRKAADRLYISQPGLSRQIKEMEKGLGIQLFERTNRKVKLTKAGDFLKIELRKHFKTLESTLAHAQLLNKGLLGDLKLGYVGSAMEEVIPRLMNGFRKSHQKVMFNLKEMDNQDQINSLFSNEIDVGFVRMERIPKGLNATTILQEPFCLVLPKNHPINNKNFKDLSQLKDSSFILFDPKYSPSYYEKVMQIFDDSGFTPMVTHNTIHSGSIYKLVAHHFGVSIVPRSLKSDHLKEVTFIELHDIPQQTALSAVWNENNRNPVLDDFLVQVQSFKSVH
jgi:DNA-binding transcriptional LysR family regulator